MASLFGSSAIISECGTWRYRLDRGGRGDGPVYAFFGVNGSTADAEENDHTVRKWIGFNTRFGGSRFIVGNAFGFRATDVRALAKAADPVGPDNDRHLHEIAAEADILVPCWGDRFKLPRVLRPRLAAVEDLLRGYEKPVLCYGLTKGGDPLHPLTLAWSTTLIPWVRQ